MAWFWKMAHLRDNRVLNESKGESGKVVVPGIEQVCTKYKTLDNPFIMSLHNIQLREFWLEEICSYCTCTVSESMHLMTLSQTVICLIAKYSFHLILLQSCL